MKPYKQLVEERYNQRESGMHIYDSPYSTINPVGFWGARRIEKLFFDIFNDFRNDGLDISKAKMIDLGCGSGGWTRYFSEMTGSPKNIIGLDLSTYRIRQAKAFNPAIRYAEGDITQLPKFKEKFDLVFAIDVYMHLNSRQEVIRALKEAKNILTNEGYFIFYDAYEKDHFVKSDREGVGYSRGQIVELAKKAGLVEVRNYSIYKKLLWKIHSVYLYRRFPNWTVKLLEKILPGPPGNIIVIFKKARSNT